MVFKICQSGEVDFGVVEFKNCESSKNALNAIKQESEPDKSGMLTHQELPQVSSDYFS